MSNAFQLLNPDSFTGFTFQIGIPPFIEPLRYIAWRRVDSHWEIVTSGFSEFAQKETTDSSRSGFGVEFVLRLEVLPGEEEPSKDWTIEFFQTLAKIAFLSWQVPTHGTVLSLIREEDDVKYDTKLGFGTEARPLEFKDTEGFLARASTALRTRGKYGLPASRQSWNETVAAFDRIVFQNDSLGLVQTANGPVQWLRCVPLLAGQTEIPADGIVRRPS